MRVCILQVELALTGDNSIVFTFYLWPYLRSLSIKNLEILQILYLMMKRLGMEKDK